MLERVAGMLDDVFLLEECFDFDENILLAKNVR